MAGSEYRKNVSDSVTTFEVTPAPAVKYGWLLFLGVVFSLIGLGFLPFLPMGGLALWLGWTWDPRPKASRQPMSFRVTSNSIETGGRAFMKDDIHRIIVKNAITDNETGLTTYTTSNSVAQGMHWRAANAQIAHTLNVESGGKSNVIAGGMDNTTAYGLLRDVCKSLDFK